ncbi:hypothetical protein HPB49_009906 [Dermacentor silvarum]|uniref:Uncharacterized protein n=1 Tax=Dermacentor silvarum TaxID=543639 RepID=A0ACB8D3X7_DERSI|nr:hypothetical protein HPB49_009906 [Dermacentor silvarum]
MGVIHGVDASEPLEHMMPNLDTFGPTILAIRMMGRAETAIKFEGSNVPKKVRYHRAMFRCLPHHPKLSSVPYASCMIIVLTTAPPNQLLPDVVTARDNSNNQENNTNAFSSVCPTVEMIRPTIPAAKSREKKIITRRNEPTYNA